MTSADGVFAMGQVEQVIRFWELGRLTPGEALAEIQRAVRATRTEEERQDS